MNLKEALSQINNKNITDYYLVRQHWIDCGSKMKLLPSFFTLSGLTNESFFADDWIVEEGKLDNE